MPPWARSPGFQRSRGCSHAFFNGSEAPDAVLILVNSGGFRMDSNAFWWSLMDTGGFLGFQRSPERSHPGFNAAMGAVARLLTAAGRLRLYES